MANAKPAAVPAQPCFDPTTPPGGYTWWYADGLSHDGDYGFTLIAFIGSVFSPYYAWSGRRDPYNHCAINLALYGRDRRRWTMTERGRHDLQTDGNSLAIGPSSLRWDGDTLVIDIAEHGMPVPWPVRGRIRLTPHNLNSEVYKLDSAGLHSWQPIAPSAAVELEFTEPRLRWRGNGYLDSNRGPSPLEDTFRYWDWSRVHAEDGRTAILYNTQERNGAERSLCLKFEPDGTCSSFEPPPKAHLPASRIFRIKRMTRSGSGRGVRLGRTLEDTPFYSRSIIESDILGARATGMHESFDGDRLAAPLVKLMLPFRMPRRPVQK
ncbi:carotenoid 1,2-hydratase [Hyphomonas sp.]|uniref:carotenoid 1,2-hydratase n=1 Tax=Hyphomonas sp. TaxID=87 RepID=UPI0025BEAAB8|nr:carotenoid 1,2-hydratase [Hyphomonas sp.]MBI1400624.1 carotenoid 1,2-hydratase [Hyphomonas sp.]